MDSSYHNRSQWFALLSHDMIMVPFFQNQLGTFVQSIGTVKFENISIQLTESSGSLIILIQEYSKLNLTINNISNETCQTNL